MVRAFGYIELIYTYSCHILNLGYTEIMYMVKLLRGNSFNWLYIHSCNEAKLLFTKIVLQ